MMLDFNPNKKPDKPEWATYVPTRTTAPKFKMHKRRGDALSAITLAMSDVPKANAILYQWQDEEWKEVYRLENFEKPDNCDICGASLIREWSNGTIYKTGKIHWINTNTEPKLVTQCNCVMPK